MNPRVVLKAIQQFNKITVGLIWQGRGLKIRVLRVGLSIILIERLDLSPNLPNIYRIHPWALENMEGMMRVN